MCCLASYVHKHIERTFPFIPASFKLLVNFFDFSRTNTSWYSPIFSINIPIVNTQ